MPLHEGLVPHHLDLLVVGPGPIEVHAAEGELNISKFYENLGYKLEGKLKSHYRKGETCFVLGKEIE